MRATILSIVLPAFVLSSFALFDAPRAASAELDNEKSTISFVGRKPDGKHDGGFKKFSADAKISPDDLSDGSLTIEIDTASLWSDNPKLTNHLKNPDFFDVRKYPKIKFESTKMAKGDSAQEGVVVGKLTMLGKTNEVEVPIVCKVENGVCTVKAEFKIDRTKWGMTYGEGKIDNDVDINASLVFNP